jgi:hypothetical protein
MTDRETRTREGRPAVAALGAADWLSLAAAPTFAAMALPPWRHRCSANGRYISSAGDQLCKAACQCAVIET